MSDRPAQWNRALELFEGALPLDEPAREAVLVEKCGSDAVLAAMLRELLVQGGAGGERGREDQECETSPAGPPLRQS